MWGAVDGGHRERVGQLVADIECLHRAVGIVDRVGPYTVRHHREGAEAARARGRSVNRRKSIGRIIDVGAGELPSGAQRAQRGVGDTAGLDRRAIGGAGDDGRVVGAVDGDRKGLIGRKRPVGYGDSEVRGGGRN